MLSCTPQCCMNHICLDYSSILNVCSRCLTISHLIMLTSAQPAGKPKNEGSHEQRLASTTRGQALEFVYPEGCSSSQLGHNLETLRNPGGRILGHYGRGCSKGAVPQHDIGLVFGIRMGCPVCDCWRWVVVTCWSVHPDVLQSWFWTSQTSRPQIPG